MKRAVDILLCGLALLTLLPFLALIAIAIVMDSGRPVFYRQERVGRWFQRFHIWKFRSMALSRKRSLITVGGDTRVTRVGRFLRATKLDELPQFWNVLRGDMSLVGPGRRFQNTFRFLRTVTKTFWQFVRGLRISRRYGFETRKACLPEYQTQSSIMHTICFPPSSIWLRSTCARDRSCLICRFCSGHSAQFYISHKTI